MDGSNAAFLFDVGLQSLADPDAGVAWPSAERPESQPRSIDGILYIEDFDADPAMAAPTADEPPAQLFSADEVAAAFAAGRQAGAAEALSDAMLVQAELQSAACQTLADALAGARDTLGTIAHAAADEVSRTFLAVLGAAVPATMRNCAADEIGQVIAHLAQGMRCEPELRVRTHPAMADMVREMLIAALPGETCVLSVCADAGLSEGDLRIGWQDGHARRDCAAIWAAIAAAMVPLRLPTLEEICHGRGC